LRRGASLVGQDGGEADAAVIVDGDVKILVTCAVCLPGAIAVAAMSGLGEARQALDIEVDQVAGPLVFLAQPRRRRVERTQPVHAVAAQDAAYRGPAETKRPGDPPAVVAKPAKSQNLFQSRRRSGAWRSVRARGPVAQTGCSGLAVAAHPLGRRLRAYAEAGRGQLQRHPLLHNSSRKLLSTMNRKSGILVIVHSIPPVTLIRRRTSFAQSDRMDNLLKHHN
jgi:hypothetical protein